MDIDWADPGSVEAERARKAVNPHLETLLRMNLVKSWPSVPSRFSQFVPKLRARYEAVGLMLRGDDQKPKIDVTIPVPMPCDILACLPAKENLAASEPMRFEVVGRVNSKGDISTTESFSRHFSTGRLLFVGIKSE
jgi:hypothetical protein